MRVGDDANGAIAASVGTMSGMAFIARSTPRRCPPPVTSTRGLTPLHVRAHLLEQLMKRDIALNRIGAEPANVTVPPTSAAAAAK